MNRRRRSPVPLWSEQPCVGGPYGLDAGLDSGSNGGSSLSATRPGTLRRSRMGRIVSVQAVTRAALGAGLVFASVLVAGPRALALDAPAGSTNPATTQKSDKDQSPDKEGKEKPTTSP